MKHFKWFLPVLLLGIAANAFALKPRMVFDKYAWADGVNPKARYLDQLMVKFYDEDMVRLRDGQLTSLNGTRSLGYTHDFLARHAEIRPDVIIKSETEEQHLARLSRVEQQSGKDLVDMFSFYCFHLPQAAADPKALLADILGAPEVETAYYEPIPSDANCQDLGSATPNYFNSQNHYDAAPLGVDLFYARTSFGADVVDGTSGTWVGCFERGADVGHEDYTDCSIITGGSGDADNDHGTAVAGIVGACDDNNVGMIGFLADHTVKIFQRNSPNYGSTADVYNFANTQLLAGEVTTSSWGYTCDPCPPGQSCPCNPSQNGQLVIEYNAGVKAAIDAGTAAGIIYCLSAGNGCVNLDWVGFGAAFDWSTGSIYVAAGQSTGDHDASCFTNFGARVTSYAWGDGVYTLAYGDLFSGTGQNEWYTNSFSGTSSAGPIVAGCAGVLNNIYRAQNAGANIGPATMRSWLGIGATPPGNVIPGTVGDMPNLFGITSPDMNGDLRTGWSSYYVIPRNSANASGSDCLLPATLVSAPDTTFWNSAWENTSNFGTAVPDYARLYRDDVYVIQATGDSLSPLQRTYFTNIAFLPETNIRGGRHTLRMTADPLNEVTEYFEDNNSEAEQFVWNARPLTAETPLTFTQPPLKTVTDQPTSYYNCDGYSFSTGFSGFWDLLGVCASTTSADYDARLFSEAITSTNGFDDYEAWSGYVGPIDIVGKNGNLTGTVSGASVINWDGANDNYRVEGETSSYLGTPQRGRNDAGAFTMDADELMEAVEFNVDSLVPYEIEADVTGGNANLVISVFGPDDNYFSLSNRNETVNANGAGQSEHLCFTPAQTGYHLALIHKYNSLDYNETATFHIYIGKSLFDLTPNLNTGWSHVLVVTQASSSPPFTLPASLSGNLATNYLDLGLMNIGCLTSPNTPNTGFFRDGPSAYVTGNMVAWAPGVEGWVYNQSPITVTGGRHNIGAAIDVNAEATEWREDNNRNDQQFVWTPYALTDLTPFLSTNTAPNYRNAESSVLFPASNQDGFRFTGSYWSGVGMVPVNPADDYNLHIYEASSGSQNGFETSLAPSYTAAGSVDFVLENGNVNGIGAIRDVGVDNNFQYPATPSLGNYRLYQCNRIQDLANNGLNGPFTLGVNQLIHVFDLYLAADDATRFVLDNLGATDLGLAIFPAGLAHGSRTQGGTVLNANGDGGDETVVYYPATTGWYGVVVFKHNSTDLASTQYRLIIGDRVPAVPQHLVLQVINSGVDPIQMRAHWDSVTTDISGSPLNVDHYQLFYTLDVNLVGFPAGWVAYLTTPQATLNFNVDSGVVNFRMVVVAVDSDGYILAHSELPGGEDATGLRLETGPVPLGGVIGDAPPGSAR